MNKLLWLGVLIVLFGTAFLVYLNRAHPKIQESSIVAIIGLLAVVLSVIFFGEAKNEINKTISAVSFVSNKDNLPEFFTSPVLSNYLIPQAVVWGKYAKDYPEKVKGLNNDKLHKAITELQVVALIQSLSGRFMFNWDTEFRTTKLPGATTTTGSSPKAKASVKDKTTFASEEFGNIFKSNRFYEILLDFYKLTLPKGTTIEYIMPTKNNNYHSIIISKTFYFNINIKLRYFSYVGGIGSLREYVGLSKTSETNRFEFGCVETIIECKASFNPFMTGNPTLLRYKKWVSDLFNFINEQFEWSICDKKIKDYVKELANRTIIEKSNAQPK